MFVFPIILFGVISYSIYENLLISQKIDNNNEIIDSFNYSFTKIINEADSYAKFLAEDYEFIKELNKKDINKSIIYSKLNFFKKENNSIDSVYLYLKSGKKFLVNTEYLVDKSYSPNYKLELQKIRNSDVNILNPCIDFQSESKKNWVLPYMAQMDNGSSILQVNINVDTINNICSLFSSENRDIYVVDEKGSILFNNRGIRILEPIFPEIKKQINTITNESKIIKVNGKEQNVLIDRLDNTKWKLVIVTDNTKLLLNNRHLFSTINILFILLILIIFVIFSIIISRGISMPIKQIEEIIENIQKGKLNNLKVKNNKDNTGLLENHYKKFTSMLHILLDEIEQHHRIEKEQEFKILQAQINPHFIYNTLGTVKLMSELNNDYETSNVTSKLISLLQSSIRIGQTFITIEEEIKQIEDYIEIQKVKYHSLFSFEMDIPEEVKKFKTLKFLLQPIVENAIFHGLDEDKGQLKIKISIKHQDKKIIYSVVDNGKGMDIDTQKKAFNDTSKVGLHSIGLANVNQRIKYFFGNDFGINIMSNTDWGTAVTIIIPVIKKEEGNLEFPYS